MTQPNSMYQAQNFHILNGDALNERFPTEIPGQRIILRCCLIDIPLKGCQEVDFWDKRADYLSQRYPTIDADDYRTRCLSEIDKIKKIPKNSKVYLWFEDDLFCQANFWFCVHCLTTSQAQNKFYLVRPKASLRYGFAALDDKGLETAFRQNQAVQKIALLSKLWPAYLGANQQLLLHTAARLKSCYPFIEAAVEAHIKRLPGPDSKGLPLETLTDIKAQIGRDSFATIFQLFSQRLPIYGYGDLQVKALLKELLY